MMVEPAPADELVCLCTPDGRVTGSAPKSTVHTSDTPLHRAFSVHLLDEQGRTLLTRRALTKRAWPGVWSNSCCGHPAPGESDADAVRRRVRQELGAPITDLQVVLPDYRYRAVDAAGIVENEVCPVYVARVRPADVHPDPAEVAETAWVPWPDAVAAAAEAPALLSPWSVEQYRALGPAAPAVTTPAAAEPPLAATLGAVDDLIGESLVEAEDQWRRSLPDELGALVGGTGLVAWADALVRGGGKRVRPAMCHWGYVATGGTEPSGLAAVARAGAALELLHAFALVHDDIMDASGTRRGMPTAHARAAGLHRAAAAAGDPEAYGRNIAILVGDLLHARADRIAGTLPPRLQEEWSALCVELIAGQTTDLVGAAGRWHDLPHARLVADLKSGAYTVARPLRMGAMIAGAGEDSLAVLDEFARHAGRAFALRDDLLGIWGDPARTGKPAGDDLREGKATVIRALAADALTGHDADLLARVGGALDPADIVRLVEALDRAGVRAEVEAQIDVQVGLARAALDHPLVGEQGRRGLTDAVAALAWRQS